MTGRRRLVLLMAAALQVPAAVAAQTYPDSGGTLENPALLAATPRTFELGLGAGIGAYTNAFALGEILQEVWTIDLSTLSRRTNVQGLLVGTGARAGSHSSLRLAGIGVGGYTRVRGAALLEVPHEFVTLLAEGNLEDRSGSGSAAVRVTAEAGAAVAVDRRGWIFGVSAGVQVPIAWSLDGGFLFDVTTTDSGVSAEAGVDLTVLSAVDLVALQAGGPLDMSGILSRGAFTVGLGVVRADAEGRPLWGVGLTDVTVIRATAANEYRLTGAYAASVENILQALLDDPEAEPYDLQVEEFEFTPIGTSDERIAIAPRLAAFYRFSVPYVDIVPHAELSFDRALAGINPGVTVAGNRFPASILSASLARTRPAWRAVLGLRLPLRPVELTVHVESISPRVVGLFGPEGLSAAFDLRVGW